jgi:hypothetical protein
MSIKIVRKMILVALALILFANVSDWVAEWLSTSIGVIWGLATAIAAFYCRTKAARVIAANKKYMLWMAIPGLLAIIPIAYQVNSFLRSPEKTWLARLWDLSPITIGFAAPVVLLWMAYSSLEKHTAPEAKAEKSSSGAS